MHALDIIDPIQIGRELQRARKHRGMTQEQAAEIIGLTRTSIIAIEKGERRIKAEELIALAEAYDQPLSDILRQRPSVDKMPLQFRGPVFRTEGDNQTIEPATIEFQDLCRNYRELEMLMNADLPKKYPAEYPIPGSKRDDRDRRVENIAFEERQRLGIGVDTPLGDLRAILENDVGLRIYYMRLPNKFSEIYGYTQELGGCLAISSVHPEERRRWSLAHGYFHFLSSRDQSLITKEESDGKQPEYERLADVFARAFLMPLTGVERRLDELGTITPAKLYNLAAYYRVSPEAFIRRIEGLHGLPTGLWGMMKSAPWKDLRERFGTDLPSYYAEKLPFRYVCLAVEAYERELVSERELARFLEVDLLEARRRAESLSSINDAPSLSNNEEK